MSINKIFNGTSIYKPGAYTKQSTLLTGNLPLIEAGLTGIIGEAANGEPGSTAGVVEWSSSRLSELVA